MEIFHNNRVHKTHAELIKEKAFQLGFMNCGIAKAEFLSEDASRLELWLKKSHQGQMHYLENHFDKRLDPRLLVDGAKSVISLTYNYFPTVEQNQNSYKIAKYAYGQDYHDVVKEKLKALLAFIQDEIGEVNGRCFVDSAPVLEHAWAQKSGIGWVGKNTLTLNKNHGSFFFLAELIIDLSLDYDQPFQTDHCGTCTKCIDSCPTQAILPNRELNGSQCISYFTIELRDQIPTEMKGKFDDWIFGCDVCQDVCPWNRFSKPHNEPKFNPNSNYLEFEKKDWEELTEEVFQNFFKNSPIKRAKYQGIKRNIDFIK